MGINIQYMHSRTLCDTLNVIENVPFQKDHVVHT